MTHASGESPRLQAALRAMRPQHWAKNLLVWVPAVAGHRFLEPTVALATSLAFLAFGLTASGLYLANDLSDRGSDLRHPRKRHRPIARGALAPRIAWPLAGALVGGGVALASRLTPPFLTILAAYAAGSLAYTLLLKRLVVVDVLSLAALYTLRLYGGAFAAEIRLSHWLAIFSLFVFLSLAALKRAAELVEAGDEVPGRGYRPSDLAPLVALGGTANGVSILVFAFYVVSPDVHGFYSHPERLWALCPIFLYVLARLWLLACRGAIAEDPVLFALKDRGCWASGALGAVVLWLAS